jgi:predicted nucleotidyltransferase
MQDDVITNLQLAQTLDSFVTTIGGYLGRRLVSIVLYGSVVFNDLAPGYGDLDFLVVIDGDLSLADCQRFGESRKPFKERYYGLLPSMMEGAFLPRKMLNPLQAGRAYWWGTRGERIWESNQLGWLTLKMIRECGSVVWGMDIRQEIPQATHEQICRQIDETCQSMEAYGKGGTLHSVDWLLTAARGLLLLREGRFASKTEAAAWACERAEGEWRQWLPRANQLRKNPALADSAEMKQWLAELSIPIAGACAELKQELARHV